jgi:hypothetical protein
MPSLNLAIACYVYTDISLFFLLGWGRDYAGITNTPTNPSIAQTTPK